jgi:hypothetical protein
MSRRAFIFTMDAILALIPVFVVLASISQLSSDPVLRLQSGILGKERVAQDVLATMEYLNLIDSTNSTAVNETLKKLIPDYLSYNYTSTSFDGGVRFTLASGNISGADDIVVAKRVGTISTGYVAIATPNIFAMTVDPDSSDDARVINAVLYSLLGIDEIDAINIDPRDPTQSEWQSIGRVTVTLGNLSTWSSVNNTMGYLLDRLIEQASAQGESQAVTGLGRLETRLQEVVTGNTSAENLKYSVNEILNADIADAEISGMRVSASEVLLAASQSANAGRGTLNPGYISMASILGRQNRGCGGGQTCDYFMNLSIMVTTPTQISAVSVGKTFYSSKAVVNLSVYEVYSASGSVKRNANISYNITSRPSYNLTNIYPQGADIRIDRFHSIAFDVDGYGEINATVVYTSTTSAVFEQREKDFGRITFSGAPIQKNDKKILTKESGDLDQGHNYRDARKIAEDGGIKKIFDRILFEKEKGDRKRGYASISDARLVSKETFIVLKLWGG